MVTWLIVLGLVAALIVGAVLMHKYAYCFHGYSHNDLGCGMLIVSIGLLFIFLAGGGISSCGYYSTVDDHKKIVTYGKRLQHFKSKKFKLDHLPIVCKLVGKIKYHNSALSSLKWWNSHILDGFIPDDINKLKPIIIFSDRVPLCLECDD